MFSAFITAEARVFADFGLHVQSRSVHLATGTTRILETGDPAAPPVLLVHGGGSNAASWAPLMAELQNWHLFAVDRPGCGLTDAFNYQNTDLREHAVTFLEQVLDALGLASAPLVGASMGGLWSLWLALDRPSRVSALALLGCPALVLGTSAPPAMRLLSVPLLNRLLALEPPDYRKLMDRMGEPRHLDQTLPRSLEHLVLATQRLPTYRTAWLSLLERALTPFGARAEYALHEFDLARISQPTTVLWGEHDPFGSLDVARQLRNVLPNASLHELPGAGHLPWLAHPKTCADAIANLLRPLHAHVPNLSSV